jgi:putative peptidoglycan lipid II flippase
MTAGPPTAASESFWRSLRFRESLFAVRAGLVRNALLVTLLTVAVKIAGAAKVAISARVLGTGDQLDAYLVAFLVPSIVCDVLAGSLTPALIPSLSKESLQSRVAFNRSRQFFLLCLGVFIVAMVLAAASSGWLLPLIAHGFSTSKLSITHRLLLMMIPMAPFSGLSAMWRAVLNHQGRFMISAASPVMTPLLASVFLLQAHGSGASALALGTVLGCAAETLLLGVGLALTRSPILPRITRDFAIHSWLSIAYVPLLMASALTAGSTVVDQTIAASLQPGSVSILNLGTRIAAVLLAIGPASVATVLMPKFAELIGEKNWSRLRDLRRASLFLGMVLMALAALIGILTAKPIAELAFAGRTGAPDSILLVAKVQALSFLQLPFVMGTSILSCLLIALRLTKRLFLLTGFALLLKIALGLLLSHWLGIAGLALSLSCVQCVVFLLMLRIASTHFPRNGHSPYSQPSVFTVSLQDVGTVPLPKNYS